MNENRKWSVTHLVSEKVYLVVCKNDEARNYAQEHFGSYKRLSGGAYVIPASKIAEHFKIAS